MKHTRLITPALSISLLFACGEDGGNDQPPPIDAHARDLAAWTRYCTETGPARALMCNSELDAPSCQNYFGCLERITLEGAIPKIAGCLESRACEVSEDRCFTAGGLGLTPSAKYLEFHGACMARLDSCAESGDGFHDDWCFMDIVRDDMISQLSTCLSRSCGEVTECMDPIIQCGK